MQLCIENVDQAGGCSYGYSCTYTDSISWAAPDQPLPMIRDPRTVFDQLFGVGATPAERRERRAEDKSILDWLGGAITRMNKNLGAADRARLADYLEDVREIERRIQQVEAVNSSGQPRELPGAPVGVPDSFEQHVKLMFDLQALALASDTTRVFAFKMGRDASNRVYAESGYKAAFHSASHHQDRDERITDFAKINKYHVSMLPYFLTKLKNTPDGEQHAARQLAHHLRLADGQLERAQPQALPAVPRRPRRRRAQGRSAPEGGRRHADGERDAHRRAHAGDGDAELRRQHVGVRSQHRAADDGGALAHGYGRGHRGTETQSHSQTSTVTNVAAETRRHGDMSQFARDRTPCLRGYVRPVAFD